VNVQSRGHYARSRPRSQGIPGRRRNAPILNVEELLDRALDQAAQ
jgi:hypothetical protein